MRINYLLSLLQFMAVGTASPLLAQTRLPNPLDNALGMGYSVAIDNDTLVLGAPLFANNGIQNGAVMVYTRVSGQWQLQQTIQRDAPRNVTGESFGRDVAISGDTLVVESRSTYNPSARDIATVYVRSGGRWSEQATLPLGLDQFGRGLAPRGVKIHGETALVTTTDDSVHVFVRSGSTWLRQARLAIPDRDVSDTRWAFGGTGGRLAVEGDTLVVGAPTRNAPLEQGAVYVFERSGSTWSLQAKLTTTRGPAPDFGSQVALSRDSLLVGNHFFQRSGTAWTEGVPLELPEAVAVGGGNGFRPVCTCYPAAIDADRAVFRAWGWLWPFRRVGSAWFFQGLMSESDGTQVYATAHALSGDTLVGGDASLGARYSPNGEFLDPGPGGGLVIPLSDTVPTGPPGAPRSFRVTVSGRSLGLTWVAPANGVATNYTLLARLAAGGPVVATVRLFAGRAFWLAAPDGTFVLSVQASNAEGQGPESASVTVSVPEAVPPPGPPSSLVESVAGTTASFRWSAPASGGPVANYLLVAGLTPSFSVPFTSVPLGATTGFSVSGVPPGTYYVRVHARNAGGTSPPSNEVSLTVAGVTAPGMPTLNVPTVSGSTVSLSWTAGSGELPTSYTLAASASPGGAPIATVPLTGTSAAFPGVPSGTYYLRLTATNGAGSSAPSVEVTLVVP